ncbi:family 43 glycosylhydrolase [Bacteroides sp. 51]|uniref:family 43 glycosylhydrolase n=1 Tax=Bacteroides sp. 51 TaxID=2302938 RepID=UPI0013D4B400|nr:family 43 glycosylhydrolase [Bacteroides sp. 51]NDV84385.1 glycosyl hydrolase family 43 [Bacteroides sp. 51]
MKHCILICIFFFAGCTVNSTEDYHKLIRNGVPWYDTDGNIVNAHGACIVEDGGRYYLFGEWKSDQSNAFPGFSCYSSDDLVTWKFENVVLGVQPEGILGPNRVGERVKVMKCPSTGEYVMYMHADDMGYKDPHIGYATCKTIAGDYEFHGPLLFEGEPIRRWDMGTFQDTDGTGYLLIHHGIIYRLSEDYRSAEAKILEHLQASGESPAMFKKNGLYYLLYSDLTSWEKNDNYYFTASSIEGPWTRQGFFAPQGSLTYYSQTTFVFPLVRGTDTIPMFMGDRWSYPHQASAATYVWMPMSVDGEHLSIPEYWQSWDVDKLQQVDPLKGSTPIVRNRFKLNNETDWNTDNGQLTSRVEGSTLEASFRGTRIAIVGESNANSGYARIRILNANKQEVLSTLVDFYSKKTDRNMRFLSPVLPLTDYTLQIEVTGVMPVWSDKSKARFGSTDSFVTVDDIVAW